MLYLLHGEKEETNGNNRVRPVVHIPANVNISLVEDGTIENPRTLSK